MKKRLDLLLVERGLVESRSRAQAMIQEGLVSVMTTHGEEILTKPSAEIAIGTEIRLGQGQANRYVSRAGLKLEGALRHLGLHVEDFECLDIGQSTGGFTDCLLQMKARKVVGVDVGHDQLAPRLRLDPRVICLEGINARALSQQKRISQHFSRGAPDLIVMDLSFISQTVVLPELGSFTVPGTRLLSLVKPQFEVGPEGLGKGGLVKDSLLSAEVRRKIVKVAQDLGWQIEEDFESELRGKDGNMEYFIYGLRAQR